MTIHKKLNTGDSFNLNQSQSGCCPDDGTTCRYSYTFEDNGKTLVSIVVGADTVALGGIDPTDELSVLITAIEAKLQAAGYSSDAHVSITAWRNANEDVLHLDFFSTVEFGDLVLDPAETITVVANCVATPYCYYEIEVPVSADVDFDIEFGKTGDVVGGNIAGDYSTGSGDLLMDDIIALFDGETFDDVELQIERVVVTENLGTGYYSVGLWIYKASGGDLFLDGEVITQVSCKPSYSTE